MPMDQNPQPPPDAMDQAEGEPQGQDQGGSDLKSLIVNIHNNLLKFKEVLMGAPQIPDEAKAGLDKVLQDYQGFVQGLATSLQGGQQAPQETAPPPAAAAKGAVPVGKGPMAPNSVKGAVPAM